MSAFGATGAGPNPTRPELLTSKERRAELCRLLALGLIRLRARQSREVSVAVRESSLHNSAARSAHANPKRRRTA
jgi:hypothetical protein